MKLNNYNKTIDDCINNAIQCLQNPDKYVATSHRILVYLRWADNIEYRYSCTLDTLRHQLLRMTREGKLFKHYGTARFGAYHYTIADPALL